MKRFCSIQTISGENCEGILESGGITIEGRQVDPFQVQSIYTEHRKTLLSSHKLSLKLEGGTSLKYKIDDIDGHLKIAVAGVTDPMEIGLSDVSRLEARPVKE